MVLPYDFQSRKRIKSINTSPIKIITRKINPYLIDYSPNNNPQNFIHIWVNQSSQWKWDLLKVTALGSSDVIFLPWGHISNLWSLKYSPILMCDEVLMSVYTFYLNELKTDYSVKGCLSSSQSSDRSTGYWDEYGSQTHENKLVILQRVYLIYFSKSLC